MRRRAIAVAAVVALGGALAVGCESGPACPRGEEQVVSHYIPITTMAGKVPVTTMHPVYECREK